MRFILTLISLFLFSAVFSQSLKIPVKLNLGVLRDGPVRTLVIPNKEKNEFCLLVIDKSRMHAFRISNDFEVLDQTEMGKPWALAHLMGGINPLNNRYTVFLRDDQRNAAVLSVDFDNDKGRIDDLPPLSKKYSLLGGLNINGLQNLVYISKKMPSEIKVLQYENEQKYKEIDFNIPELADLKEITKKGASSEIAGIYYNFLRSTQFPVKLYPVEDGILLTTNVSKHTRVVRLNLDEATTDVKLYSLPPITGRNGAPIPFGANSTNYTPKPDYGNSFYHNGLLIQGSCTAEKLRLNVTNLASGEIIQDFVLTADDSTFVKHSPFHKITPKAIVTTEKELTAKAFIRTISRRGLGIAVNEESNQLSITVGNYINSTSAGFYSFGSPGNTISTPYGNVTTAGTPGSYNPGNSTLNCTFFKLLVEKGDWAPLPLHLKANSLFREETSERAPHAGNSVYFKLEGKVYKFSYDSSNKVISIEHAL